MHTLLESIKSELVLLAQAVNSSMPNEESPSIAHQNWSFPSLSKRDLVEVTTSLLRRIDAEGSDAFPYDASLLSLYPARLAFLRVHTVPQIWSSAHHGIPAYLITLDGLDRALTLAFGTHERQPEVGSDDAEALRQERVEVSQKLKRSATLIRTLEARLAALDPRTAELDSKIAFIEKAHDLANQLPADIETLQEEKSKLRQLLSDAVTDRADIKTSRENSQSHLKELEALRVEASAVMERCDAAYTAATSQGLAKAFDERSAALTKSMYFWIGGLVTSLTIGAVIGWFQLHSLVESIKASSQTGIIWLNVAVSILSVGAPVWFSWMATKQIGQQFRLAEDYGFKASISKAYEGYRSEAFRLDPELQHRLFSSALARLDEQPLRVIDSATPGSPFQDILSSDVVKKAGELAPEFATLVSELASKIVGAIPSRRPLTTASATEKEASA